jgi:protease-4
MSDFPDLPPRPEPPTPPGPPRVLPVRYPPPPPPPRSGGGVWRVFFALVLLASLGLNLLVCGGLVVGLLGDGGGADNIHIRERFHSGSEGASGKVAVVQIEGVIMEGLLGYVHRQIERAAGDKAVKAVVVRIESPGGTITASDDLHRRLVELRDGTTPRFKVAGTSAPKPLVVSMGAMAASGGYYVAMPAAQDPKQPRAKKVFAEPTTITGSIGVYASFPNIAGFAEKYGLEMDMIKAGDIKGSGSLFHKMSPQERQPWEDMVNHAYNRFLDVVAAGRAVSLTRAKLTKDLFNKPQPIPLHDDKGNVLKDDDGKEKTATYNRKLADGGIYTADEAARYGLVDAVGTLEDAIAEAAGEAGLTTWRAVTYERPPTLLSLLSASDRVQSPTLPDAGKLAAALGPRVWYLAPRSELAAVLQALGKE